MYHKDARPWYTADNFSLEAGRHISFFVFSWESMFLFFIDTYSQKLQNDSAERKTNIAHDLYGKCK